MEMNKQLLSSVSAPSVNKSLDLREVVTIYLKLYDTHWNHRIKIFSFFITIEVVLFGAYTSMLLGVFKSANNNLLMVMLAAASCAVTVILFFMDMKLKKLLYLTCMAIRKFEEVYEAEFTPEMRLMSNIKASVSDPDLTVLFRLSYGFAFAMSLVLIVLPGFVK